MYLGWTSGRRAFLDKRLGACRIVDGGSLPGLSWEGGGTVMPIELSRVSRAFARPLNVEELAWALGTNESSREVSRGLIKLHMWPGLLCKLGGGGNEAISSSRERDSVEVLGPGGVGLLGWVPRCPGLGLMRKSEGSPMSLS